MTRRPLILLGCGAWLALTSCGDSPRVAGNSANTGNSVTGRILTPKGAPAPGAWVECRPDSLAPWQPLLPGWTALTDSTGHYRCTDLPDGSVGITSSDPGSGLSRWRPLRISPSTRPDSSLVDTLALPGRLRVALPPDIDGTLFLSGLGLSVTVQERQEIEISDIPAGWHGSVKLALSSTVSATVDSATVPPGTIDSAGYTRHSLSLRVPLAGGLSKSVAQLPVLIRLDSAWTGFVTSLADGSDLRISLPNGTPLPLSVAAWDKTGRTGALWTRIDSLRAPGDSIDLVLSQGVPVPTTSSTAPFTSAAGWSAAWPLGDSGSKVSERLGSFPGTATATTSVPGLISKASHFDGRLSQIVIPGTTGGALPLPEGGPYTVSCWARLKDFGTSRFVMGRGEQGTNLKFQRTFGADTNMWLAKDFRASPAGGYFIMAKADTSVWTHLAMTVTGNTVSLYVNGVRQATDSGFNGDAIGKRDVNLLIGAAIDTLGNTSQHFSGDLAEVWVQSVNRSPDWIRLVAANQRLAAPVAKLTSP